MIAFIESLEPESETTPGTSYNCGLTELVRGTERDLIDKFAPMVRRESVSLDLHSVERIDAAGIAALISLYRMAHESGHRFALANVAPRVCELLKLVGLERILVSHNAKSEFRSAPALVQNLA